MSTPIKAKKRSSLKIPEKLSEQDRIELQKKHKRNSISWKLAALNEIKAVFAKIENNKVEGNIRVRTDKGQNFQEARRRSIKNEYSLVKELLKRKEVVEEIEKEEDVENLVKANTIKNIGVGKHSFSTSSQSPYNSDDEEEKKK